MEVMLTNTLLTCALPTLLDSLPDVMPLVAIETKVKGKQNTNDEHKAVDASEEGGNGDNNVENRNGGFEDGEEQFSDDGVHENNPNKINGDANSNDGEGEENGDAEDEEVDGEGPDDDDDDDNADDDDGEGPDEEDVVEEEPEDDEEEDEEEETIQPPKKRKK